MVASSLLGQEGGAPLDKYLGLPVNSISFEPEAQPLPREELDSLLAVKVGEPLHAVKLRQSIERIVATGRYQEVIVDAEHREDGVSLRFMTRGTWFIGRVTVAGVPEPPNRGQLVNTTKLKLGERFEKESLQQAAENLRTRLEANGFFESRVDSTVSYDEPTEQVRIDFRVDPGPRARLTMPEVNGVPPDAVGAFVDQTRWRRWFGMLGWYPLTERRLQNGLERARRSYVKQDYLLNRVTLNSIDYDGTSQTAKPRVTINLGPQVRIRAEGMKVSQGRLRQLVPVFQEQALDRDLIAEGQRNLAAYLQNQGYFRAAVTVRGAPEGQGRRAITYLIDRGVRYKLDNLAITGNRYFTEETIRERMNIQPATFLRYRQGRFSENLLENDLDAIRALYQSNGFRDAEVTSSIEENYGGKPRHLGVVVKIVEGPQWIVGRHEITGVSPERAQEVERKLSSVEGQPFSEENLAADRDNVLNFYYNEGYQDASFEWSVLPMLEDHRVEVKYVVHEGRQMFVRGLLVSGLQTSDPEMVFRRIQLQDGEPLSQAKLVESQRRLYDLGVFARVDMAIQNPEGTERGKYVLYQFEEARKYSVNVGLGAEITRIGGGTPNFDAPAGEPGFSPRISFGVTRVNFYGTGHTVGLQTRASNIQQRALISYLAPQFKGRENVTLNFIGLIDRSRDVRTFQAQRVEGTLQLTHKLNRQLTLQPRFTYRRNSISQLAIDPALIPIYARAVRVGVLAASLYQDRRDDPIDSHRGYYNSIDFGLASKVFGSQADYTRFLARNSTYHRLGRDVILARSFVIGGLVNNKSGEGPDQIPLAERYFAGGATTHRGFPENQAGPRDLSTGFPLGGSALFMNNFELRTPLLGERLGAVLFHDSGHIYRSIRDISFRFHQRDVQDFDYMVHAVGFGLRYKTPVGPVRLDLAYSVNSPRFQYEPRQDLTSGPTGPPVTTRINRFQFHFSLGQTF
ncbi:MAG: BamA/TamA family outer membrane protein [Bryobacterales bacterium]|nr:BamA/TamA family outer membrane protein [Bryobacterales bacterium]